jgi:hypothetical protein
VNRAAPKNLFVPFSGGHPTGKAEDVVTGFLNANGEARGPPVAVAFPGRDNVAQLVLKRGSMSRSSGRSRDDD